MSDQNASLEIGTRVVVSWVGTTRVGHIAGPVFDGTVRGTRYVPVAFTDTLITVPDVDVRVIRPAPLA